MDNKSSTQKSRISNLVKSGRLSPRRQAIGQRRAGRQIGTGLLLLAWLTTGCDSYSLQRASFPVCAKPSATIGVQTDRLEATLFLADKQGDVGAVGWDLGDGRNKMGDRIKVAYDKPGTYTVTAILANPCDDKFTTSRPITVQN